MDKTAQYYLSDSNIIAFPKMGLEFHIKSVAFTVFGFEIRWYGVLIALGLLLAMIYGFKRMKEFGLDSDRAIDAVLAGIIGGIIGARLYFIAFNADTPITDFFRIRQGGLAIYGGLIGALIVGLVVARFRKVKILPFLDVASLGFLIGQGIGRWGNFVNKEAFGAATEMPWGMASATIQDTLGSASGPVLLAHPCFLYESIWCAIGFVLLHFYSKRRRFDGEIFLLYTAWYGFGRFFIEGLRMDSLYIGRLRVSQLLAAICVIASLVIFFIQRGRVKREGFVLYCNTEESKQLLVEAEERVAGQSKAKDVPAEEAQPAVEETLSPVEELPVDENTGAALPEEPTDIVSEESQPEQQADSVEEGASDNGENN